MNMLKLCFAYFVCDRMQSTLKRLKRNVIFNCHITIWIL